MKIYDITKFCRNHGLVGESHVAITMTAVAISGKPIGFGIEASAGAGKTETLNTIFAIEGKNHGLIDQKYVSFWESGSNTALYYKSDEINEKPILVSTELQKDKGDNTIEAFKSMTEGKSAKRNVTNMAQGTVDTQEIKPKTVIYSLAVENDYKTGAELQRRFITMSTDVSKKQTEDVLRVKGMGRWDKKSTECMTDLDVQKVKRSVNSLIPMKYNVLNPFAPFISEIMARIAPDQKIRSTSSHFFNVVEGVTKLNLNQYGAPIMISEGDSISVLVNIQDVYQTLDIYKNSFIRDIHGIPPQGDIVLNSFDSIDMFMDETPKDSKGNVNLGVYVDNKKSGAVWYDVQDIKKAIHKGQNVAMKTAIVKDMCDRLVDAGYLSSMKDGAMWKYKVEDKYTEFKNPSYTELLDSAKTLVKDKYPERYEQWLEIQSKDYTHPITGEVIKTIDL